LFAQSASMKETTMKTASPKHLRLAPDMAPESEPVEWGASGARLAHAVVTASKPATAGEEGACLVRAGTSVLLARRAAGCLLEPGPGDTVLVSIGARGEAFVLCVLERAAEVPPVVGVPGGFTLAAGEGAVDVQGRRVNIAATESIGVEAGEVRMRSEGETYIRAGRLSLAGDVLTKAFETVRTTAGAVERSLGRLVERIANVYRRVDEAEDSRVGRYRLNVTGNMRLRAKNASLEAQEDVAVDGRKIHLG
jgi:hypothetical protein